MMNLDDIEKDLLKEVANINGVPDGAYNFRVNGQSVGRRSSDSIEVKSKRDKSGIDVIVKSGVKNEAVHIPVIISVTGHVEDVYNDFFIGENSEVTIVAGCGIYNCGADDSIHNGIHTFHVGKGAKVKYIEKHYGVGPGASKILNPISKFFLEKDSYVEVEMEQIKGVDSTKRETYAELMEKSKIIINERLFTHGRQNAESKIQVELIGKDSTCDIVSRSVATDESSQLFTSHIVGKTKCKGHSECDAILMDKAKVFATPALDAENLDAELIHEAAIGKIAGVQLLKLMSLGLSRSGAESQIINGFLR